MNTVIFLEGRLQPKEWVKLASEYRKRINSVYVIRRFEDGTRKIDTAKYILRDKDHGGNALFKLIRATKTRVVIYRIKRREDKDAEELPVATYEEETLIRRLMKGL